jgi:hypothetical protein
MSIRVPHRMTGEFKRAALGLVTTPLPRRAKRRPMLPKQTQLQKSTLPIQIPHSMVSGLTQFPTTPEPLRPVALPTPPGAVVIWEAVCAAEAGDGIISGFRERRTVVPDRPTRIDKINPGAERSIRYQRAGLTRARVREACSVDVQGSFLCKVNVSTWDTPGGLRKTRDLQ